MQRALVDLLTDALKSFTQQTLRYVKVNQEEALVNMHLAHLLYPMPQILGDAYLL